MSKIVIDRGYLDGEDLWELEKRGILFVIVGKAGMIVVEDAQAIAKGELGKMRETTVTRLAWKEGHPGNLADQAGRYFRLNHL
jgi:hypothetical protein